MNLVEIYNKFPTQKDCIEHLEKIKWNNKPTCPYCHNCKSTKSREERI